MCGDEGNLIAEGFGVLVIMGRYVWVAHQARLAVRAAEAVAGDAILPTGAEHDRAVLVDAR